ncbi:Dynamin-like GTPase that mediates homotypic ER fusion [Boothiomyces macroporosus]|uniref:Dynamin-like GTPase that mediates homotypic ER fusion n=1 Tax=Boothiomyces macroporosus TaxID=261099 RepID=A0AAD5UHK4_9FUNG|nr:Dynamin-like GTPase that mediates homotypic ER fusion [Boothiomyces macroporosus]
MAYTQRAIINKHAGREAEAEKDFAKGVYYLTVGAQYGNEVAQAMVKNNPYAKFEADNPASVWSLNDAGFDYSVIAVFGSQSTGKSTLLNHLFSTTFDVMNAETGRSQTTKGIWMSKTPTANMLVLDVEGTDGRERGEDQDFERKSALFSLATAEVVIVNMWEQTVGLYNGANMSLLRTVLEVNLQLFQKNGTSKTCLFFVLRDSTAQAPLEKLAETLKTDLEKLWTGISKPPGKENALISDYFDFSFARVAHKIYAADKFAADMLEIKERFFNKAHPEYVLKSKYHKGIPADGFHHFAKSIWDKILANKDLDLPTQQQLLAQYRCDEIAKQIFTTFNGTLQSFKPLLDSGLIVSDFGQQSNTIISTSFDKDAQRYHSETYKAKRLEFIEKMHSSLHVYFLQQLRNLHKKCIGLFQKTIADKLRGDDSHFSVKLEESQNVAKQEFMQVCKEACIKDANWTYDQYYTAFLKDIEELSAQKREEALNRLSKSIEKTMLTKLAEPVVVLLNDAPNDLWTKAVEILSNVIEETKRLSEVKLSELGVSEDVVQVSVLTMKHQAWELLLKVAKDEVADVQILEKLRRRFESQFRYDDKGLPRVWKPTDDIDSLFAVSKEKAEQLLTLISKFDVPTSSLDQDIVQNSDFDVSSFQIISPTRQQVVRERFGKEADGLYVEAKRSTVASRAVIPPWFIVMTIALGWNEFLAILRNPLLTLLFLIAIATSYLIYYTKMGGPVLQVVKASTREVGNQVKEQLKSSGYDLDTMIPSAKDYISKIVNGTQPQAGGDEIEMESITQEKKEQ